MRITSSASPPAPISRSQSIGSPDRPDQLRAKMQPRSNSPNPFQNGNPYFSDNANSSSTRASATRNLPHVYLRNERPRQQHIREYRLGRGLVRHFNASSTSRARFRGSLGGTGRVTDNPTRRHQYLDQIWSPVVCVPPVCKEQPLDPGVDGRLRNSPERQRVAPITR